MKSDSIELSYWLSARDRTRVHEELARRCDKPSDPNLYYITHPWVARTLDLVLAFVCVRLFFHDLPRLWERDISDILGLGGILLHLAALYLLLHLIGRARAVASRLLRRGASAGEGVMWGAHRLAANSESLTVSLSASESNYRWTAFQGLEKTKDMLLLMLTPRSAVAVPSLAFKTKADEQAFCDLIEANIRAARLQPGDEESTLGA